MIKRIIAVLLLVAVLLCGFAAAEGYGTLTITVLDQNGDPISNAAVTIESEDNTITKSINTPLEGDGKVSFGSLAAGTYKITTTKAGYLTDYRTKAVVADGTVPETIRLQMEDPITIEIIDATSNKAIENAQVTVNGKTYTSDKYGRVSAAMTKNGYNTVHVSVPTYVDYNDDSKYISETDTAFQIPMTLAKVNPNLLIYNVEKKPVGGAIVSVDGKQVSVSDTYGTAILPTYTAGVEHTLDITRTGYTPYTQKISFTTNQTNYVITLTYASAPVTVTVKTAEKVLPNAIIYFDGINVGKTNENGIFTTKTDPGQTISVSASLDGYTGKVVNCTVEGNTENTVTIEMTETVPTTAIALGVLGGILVLLIVILVIVWRRRGRKEAGSKQSYPPTQRRDSL